MTVQDERWTVRTAASPARQFQCAKCRYGVIRSAPPERCPMCGEAGWERITDPFRGHGNTDAPLYRESRR